MVADVRMVRARSAGRLIPAGIGTDNDVARSLTASHTASHTATGRLDPNEMTFVTVAPTLDANFGRLQGHDNQHIDGGAGMFIAHSLRGEGFDASEDGTGRGTPIVPVAFDCKGTEVHFRCDGTHPTLRSMGHRNSHGNSGGHAAIAFAENARGELRLEGGDGQRAGALSTGGGKPGQGTPTIAWSIMPQNSGTDFKARPADVAQPLMAGGPVGGNQGGDYIQQEWQVRRLTPTECARLQGFPDDHCTITYRGKPAADGPIYKSYGNSWAVPNGAWILARLADRLQQQRIAA